MEVVNPIRDGVQIGSDGSGLCGSWINISWTPLGFLEYWGIYRAKRWSGGHPRWAQPTRARLDLLACPGGLCSPQSTPRRSQGPLCSFWSKKISVKFRCVWTPFGIDFLPCKKHGKNSNWHLALCQQVSTKKMILNGYKMIIKHARLII